MTVVTSSMLHYGAAPILLHMPPQHTIMKAHGGWTCTTVVRRLRVLCHRIVPGMQVLQDWVQEVQHTDHMPS